MSEKIYSVLFPTKNPLIMAWVSQTYKCIVGRPKSYIREGGKELYHQCGKGYLRGKQKSDITDIQTFCLLNCY